MTTEAESELLTRVGPGTPMGALMREYWLPALRSSEVVAGGDPVRLMLLGEKLIAFRDKSGKLGVMDYYRMQNIQADTEMRSAIAGPGGEAKK